MFDFFRSAKKKKVLHSESFCPIPFLQLQLNPLGNVSACCFSGEHKVGNIQESKIEAIWNGEEMRRWRREFLTGEIKICDHAMKTFQCHKNYRHLIEHVQLDEVQSKMPRKLDLRLNGKCNLECVMCDVWRQPNQLYDQSDFWSLGPEKIFPFLLEIDMLGGEPFIQKDTYRLIDEVLKVNQSCKWGFITNCQYKFTSHLESYLDRIHVTRIHMSLDSVNPDTYPKIRKQGDWQKTLATVNAFVAYRNQCADRGRSIVLFASMCVQKDNWKEIPEFLDFCDERGIYPLFQNVIGREHLSLRTIEREKLEFMRAQLKELADGKYREALSPVIHELQSTF